MHRSETSVRTTEASKYLQQLCKHFAHKVPVEYDPAAGFADFPFGKARMAASADQLDISCEAPTPEAQEVLHRVIQEHLVKFAWRENIEISWKPQRDATG